MVDTGVDKPLSDAEIGDDSMLNIARAVWQVRWLTAVFLVAGSALGVWYESQQMRFRTTMTLRLMAPNVSYLYGGFWDVAGRTRAGQIRGVIGGHPQSATTFLRVEKEAWLMRLEVMHDLSGAGVVVCEEILESLQELDDETAAAVNGPQGDGSALLKLQQSLEQLETLLAAIPQSKTPGGLVSEDPITRLNQQFTGEAGLKIPVENLPLFPWYRSLQVRVSRVLATTTAEGTVIECTNQLILLQQQATTHLVEYWWSLDMLVSSRQLPAVLKEAVSEQNLATPQRKLQCALIGFWLSGFSTVLFAVLVRWLRLKWPVIVRPDLPQMP